MLKITGVFKRLVTLCRHSGTMEMSHSRYFFYRPLARRADLAALGCVLLLGLLVRYVALVVLSEPLPPFSDSANYIEMARTLSEGLPMRDAGGNVAFFSPGYPMVLALAFEIAGAGLSTANAVNLTLGAVTTLVTYLLAKRATGDRVVALIAATAFAVLIPAVAGSAMVLKENLSVPLLVGFTLAVVALLETRRPRLVAGVAGLLYGVGVLAGASVILTGGVIVVALIWRKQAWRETAAAGCVSVIGAALIVAPWLWHVDQTLGRPVLTTNGSFNLYVGNNPVATGRFVSMRDSPLGAQWRVMRARDGELRATDHLGELAVAYIRTHPTETSVLAMRKLGLFWLPDFPDQADRSDSKIITALRWAEALQHIVIVFLGAFALIRWRQRSKAERLILITVGCFWIVHAAAYVMPRYRLPVLPLLLVTATSVAMPLVRRTIRTAAVAVPA